MNSREFGELVKKTRSARRLSVRDLELLTGISHTTIINVEKGRRKSRQITRNVLANKLALATNKAPCKRCGTPVVWCEP